MKKYLYEPKKMENVEMSGRKKGIQDSIIRMPLTVALTAHGNDKK